MKKTKGLSILKRFLMGVFCTGLALSALPVAGSLSNGNVGEVNAMATQSSSRYDMNFTKTGNGANDIVAAANAQIGKTGSGLGFSEQWCADFVTDMASIVGQGSAIPKDGYCPTLQKKIKNAGGRYVSLNDAKKGDIVFFGSGGGSHVGIVSSVNNGRISTIEGNTGSGGSLYSRKVSSYSSRSGITYVMRPNYQNKKPSIRLHAWVSKQPMGKQATALFTDDNTSKDVYYLCYEILNNETGKRLDGQKYKVTESIFDPSGKKVHAYTYTNNNNWIGYRALKPGNYRGTVTISGDYKLTTSVSFNLVQPKVKSDLWFSYSSMGKRITSAQAGKPIYVCFQFREGHSNNLFNQTVTKKYCQTIYVYDGTKLVYTKSHDNTDQMLFRFKDWKKNHIYRVVVRTTSGFYNGSITKTIVVK